jgi:hypothetical protein
MWNSLSLLQLKAGSDFMSANRGHGPLQTRGQRFKSVKRQFDECVENFRVESGVDPPAPPAGVLKNVIVRLPHSDPITDRWIKRCFTSESRRHCWCNVFSFVAPGIRIRRQILRVLHRTIEGVKLRWCAESDRTIGLRLSKSSLLAKESVGKITGSFTYSVQEPILDVSRTSSTSNLLRFVF